MSKNSGVFKYKKFQAPNNKQYPNSKLQKIPLTLRIGGKQVLTCRELSTRAQAEGEFSSVPTHWL